MEEKISPLFKGIQKGEIFLFYQKYFTIHVELDTLKKRGNNPIIEKDDLERGFSLRAVEDIDEII